MKRFEQREQAFILLFENEFQSEDNLIEIYEEEMGSVSKYAKELFNGVNAEKEKIDSIISTYSKGWKIARLPKVSVCILRIAVYEIDFVEETPDSVAINEAVELAKKYGSDDDASFINGILGTYVRSK